MYRKKQKQIWNQNCRGPPNNTYKIPSWWLYHSWRKTWSPKFMFDRNHRSLPVHDCTVWLFLQHIRTAIKCSSLIHQLFRPEQRRGQLIQPVINSDNHDLWAWWYSSSMLSVSLERLSLQKFACCENKEWKRGWSVDPCQSTFDRRYTIQLSVDSILYDTK